MLSVCIPVFNVNVTKLVRTLEEQASKLEVPVEIILIDDHSESTYANENKALSSPAVNYLPLAENVGRARIRNLFLKYVKHDNLLFLDCDSEIIKADFLSRYVVELKKGMKVICGGRVYSEAKPSRATRLHWKYGVTKESKQASVRQQNPNSSFMTNNFAVDRKVFEDIKLDERLNGYGHEDTLFGYELKKRGIAITHIDNPVLHAELHTNKVFIENTESAIRNLNSIVLFMGNDKEFVHDVALLRAYSKLKSSGLLLLLRISFAIKSSIIRSLLCAGYANMFLLNYYKLGYYAKIKG